VGVGLSVIVGETEGEGVLDAVGVTVEDGVIDGEEVAVAGTVVAVGLGAGEEESAQPVSAEHAAETTRARNRGARDFMIVCSLA